LQKRLASSSFLCHNYVLELVDGIFVFAEASLCGAEYGMCLCVLVQSVGDEACPDLVKSICKADRAI